MNVLLIWPPSPSYCILTEDFSCCEPLALEYIAAPLVENYSIDILDARIEPNYQCVIRKKSYDIVGLSIPYTVSVNVCNEIIKDIKSFHKDIKVVIGGHYPTVTLEKIMLEYVDFAVIGEGVESFSELVNCIESGTDVFKVKNIAIIDKGNIHYTEKKAIETLDTFPAPARQLTKKYHEKYFHAHYKNISLVRFSTGCIHRCSFCILWKITNRKYITRSNDLILKELSEIENQNIYVVDDEAFLLPKKMNELADLLITNNIRKKYHMYLRPDTAANNPDVIEKWANAGLDSVLIGMESVFEDDLKNYRKGINISTLYKCIDILHKNNIQIRANFIVSPDFTLNRFQKLKDAIAELNIDKPTFSVLTPFVGTDEYEKSKDKFIIDKLEFFDCYHAFTKTHLPLEIFYREFASLFQHANARNTDTDNARIFYSGTAGAFETMINKMKDSFLHYRS